MSDPGDSTQQAAGDAALSDTQKQRDGWSQRRQDLGAVLWPSFLAAAGASILCFAFIDPLALDIGTESANPIFARMTGYALGFFFFWLVAACSSFVTLYLVRTAHAASTGDGD
jgi:hypothetical protein